MPTAGIKVLFIDKSWEVEYEVSICSRMHGLMTQIAKFDPDVIVTSTVMPGALNHADFELRKKWIHVDPNADAHAVMNAIESCYIGNLWGEHPNQGANQLVSVYTATYNTGDYLHDAYHSLREQTYTNWEWVVVDDESTDGTWDKLLVMANEDHRVRPIRIKHNGRIGFTKDMATRLSIGKYLIEFDHDDTLAETAVDEVRKAFDADPEVGMVYSNCACLFADGSPHRFTDDFWKDRYRWTEYRGKKFLEAINPDIYDRFGPHHSQQFGWFLTVGPNHLRAYRASFLKEIGGYNSRLPVADDWDLMARAFLRSKCHHIDKLLYFQRIHDAWQNTTFTRNKAIQDHLALGRSHYDREFYEFNSKRLNAEQPAKMPADKGAEGVAGPGGDPLSIIVLDYNTKDLTLQCLQSIRACHDRSYAEIILIQNGAHFDTDLADKTIKLETNIGFAAGCNRGAMEATGNVLCFLNSDTKLEHAIFQRLYDKLQDPAIGVVGPYCDHAKPPQGYYGRGNEPATDTVVNTVVGVCLMIKRQLFEELGGFDTNFCNFEDDDLCRRVRARGLKCVIAGASWIHHEEHASFKANNLDVEAQIVSSKKIYEDKWPGLAVVAITLNETKALPGFFAQFKGITSKFAILDSGSTDGTIEWAKANGVAVDTRKFDNFANQRNAAIHMPHNVPWMMMFDPDERLDQLTLDNLYNLIRSDHDIYLSPLRAKNYDGSYVEWVPKAFLFRNSPDIKWVFTVHEKMIGSHKQAIVKNAMITHHLDLHDPSRRAEMGALYDKLGKDSQIDTFEGYPILNYNHRDDDRLAKIYNGPLVSVIIPTYDREELLAKAIESVMAQDYAPIEIIVVGDNCPTLNADHKVANLSPRLRVVNLPTNHGAGGAVPRNYGIMLASGQYIGYLDDDNTFKSDHISSVMAAIMDSGAEFGVSSMEVNGKIHLCDKMVRGYIDTSCVVHKKDLVRRFGFWKDRNEAGYAHDWEFVSRWAAGGVKFAFTKKPTLVYNADTSGQKDFIGQLVESK